MRRLVYYIATTLDGFIAREDGSFDMFADDPQTIGEIFAEYPETCPTHLRGPLGIDAPARHFDTVVMGRGTHQPALDAGLTSAYPHLDQYVLTRRRDLPADDRVHVVEQDPVGLVQELKRRGGHDSLDIWLCGGGVLASQVITEIDELRLKINPVTLGAGRPMFAGAAEARFAETERRRIGEISFVTYRRR